MDRYFESASPSGSSSSTIISVEGASFVQRELDLLNEFIAQNFSGASSSSGNLSSHSRWGTFADSWARRWKERAEQHADLSSLWKTYQARFIDLLRGAGFTGAAAGAAELQDLLRRLYATGPTTDSRGISTSSVSRSGTLSGKKTQAQSQQTPSQTEPLDLSLDPFLKEEIRIAANYVAMLKAVRESGGVKAEETVAKLQQGYINGWIARWLKELAERKNSGRGDLASLFANFTNRFNNLPGPFLQSLVPALQSNILASFPPALARELMPTVSFGVLPQTRTTGHSLTERQKNVSARDKEGFKVPHLPQKLSAPIQKIPQQVVPAPLPLFSTIPSYQPSRQPPYATGHTDWPSPSSAQTGLERALEEEFTRTIASIIGRDATHGPALIGAALRYGLRSDLMRRALIRAGNTADGGATFFARLNEILINALNHLKAGRTGQAVQELERLETLPSLY